MKKIITICVLALLIVPVLSVTATENDVLESEIQTITAVSEFTPQSIDIVEKDEKPIVVNTVQTPNTPTISGQTSITIGEKYEYTITTIDPQGDDVFYKIIWEDCLVCSIEGPHESGKEVKITHTWTDFYSKSDKFTIYVKAMDIEEHESNYATLEVYVEEENSRSLMEKSDGEVSIPNTENQAPSTPLITGSSNGVIGERYEYTVTAVDPQGDDVYYKISWGDCAIMYWDGPHKSGEEVTYEHAWCGVCCPGGGDFTIQVWVKDVNENIGECKTFEVSIGEEKQESSISSPILQFLERLMERFPLLENLLDF